MASEFHGRMMNIQVDQYTLSRESASYKLCYKTGHRDARHAAAEIALEADAELARLTARLTAAEAETLEQARLNGMGAERELALLARAERAEAALARAREEETQKRWRLLRSGDVIEPGDQGLQDDCVTWRDMAGWEYGMRYNPGVLVPMRRALRNGETGGENG